MNSKKGQNFVQGALILSASTAIVKVIGAFFKIPLYNLLDDGGVTHFNNAYQIYSMLFVISSTGLPTAVSKMVSEAEATGRRADARRIFAVALKAFLVIGALFAAGMFFFSETLTSERFFNDPDGLVAVMVMAPAVLFSAVTSSMRGLYQGRKNMIPTAISQVCEALGKLLFGLALAYYFMRVTGDSRFSAAGAIGGVTIGTMAGMIFLAGYTFKFNRKNPIEGKPSTVPVFGNLIKIAVPITLSSAVLSVTNLIDSAQIMRRLEFGAGIAHGDALKLSDAYGMSLSLYMLPSAFIMTIAVSIVPAISDALARRDTKSAGLMSATAIRVTLLLALPAAGGLFILARPITALLYAAKSAESVTLIAQLLSAMAVAVPFVCVVSLSNAVLQGMGHYFFPLISMSIGAVIKISANYVLLAVPSVNIHAAPIGTVLCYGTIAIINISYILYKIKPPGIFGSAFKILLSTVVMCAAAYGTERVIGNILGEKIAVIVAILVAITLYLAIIVLLKALKKEDVLLLPKGHKLVTIIKF